MSLVGLYISNFIIGKYDVLSAVVCYLRLQKPISIRGSEVYTKQVNTIFTSAALGENIIAL